MLIELIKHHALEIATFIAGLSAWGYERNKRRLDLKESETNNNKSIMDLYQEALDDLKKRYDEKFADLEKEIETLRKSLNKEKQKYSTLKMEFETYKKSH